MQRFATCPAERLRGIRGILTDVDDTLARGGEVESSAADALAVLAHAGIPVIAVTGRPAAYGEALVARHPIAAVAAENGGVLLRWQGGRLLREFTVDAPVRAARTARLAACEAAILAALPHARRAADSAGRLTDIAMDHGEEAHLDEADIRRVHACMVAHGLQATVSSIHVNGWIGEHDKATGARWAVERALGRAFVAAEWLCIGDSPNDEALFAAVPLSVGVANLRPLLHRLKVPPAYIADGERGAGFAEVALALRAAHAAPR